MFVKVRERLNLLVQASKDIKNGRCKFDPNESKFGLSRFEQLFPVYDDEIKGFPCVGYNVMNDPVKYGIKVNPLELRYDEADHPCKLEVQFIKEFTNNVVIPGLSPHITFYFTDFYARNNQRALTSFPLKLFRHEIYKYSSVLVSEFVPGGSIEEWVQEVEPTEEQWKYIIFSMAWTLLILQDKYQFMHNDFHFGNVLIDNSIDPADKAVFSYKLCLPNGTTQHFQVPNCGIIPKIWDFEFGNAYKNMNVAKNVFGAHDDNIPTEYNPYYDLHYFLTSLLELYLPESVEQFIRSLYPVELIPELLDCNSESSEDDSSDTEGSFEGSDADSVRSGSSLSYSDDYMYYNTDEEDSIDSIEGESADTRSDKSNCSDSDSEYRTEYLLGDRMLNGAEKKFDNLPTPRTIIMHDYFKHYRTPTKSNGKKDNRYIEFKYNLSA